MTTENTQDDSQESRRKINVLLTGASGSVGSEALKQLANDERFSVTVFDLKTWHSMNFFRSFKKKIKIVYGDIRKPNELEKAVDNVDVAIHLAAIIPPLADKDPHLAYQVNVGGTQNLLIALEKKSPQAFFLYSSSISVYGDRVKNPLIKVADNLQPSEHDHYAHTKIEAEESIQKSKLTWSIFRLTAIMGYRNHKISGLMFEMPLNTSMEIATPQDTARAFVSACEHQKELGKKIFNLAGGRDCRITYQEFLSRSFRAYGMGELNFPKYSFAEKNFHCGFYADGDKLENILHFRKDTISYYFETLAKVIPPLEYWGAVVFKKIVKPLLLTQSLPYKGYRKKDIKLLERFFNDQTIEAFEKEENQKPK